MKLFAFLLCSLLFALVAAPLGRATGTALGRAARVAQEAPPLLRATGSSGAVMTLTGSGALNRGKFSVSWKHDPDKTPAGPNDVPPAANGPQEPITVSFEMEPNGGESMRSFLERCRDAVDLQRMIFPPNVAQ